MSADSESTNSGPPTSAGATFERLNNLLLATADLNKLLTELATLSTTVVEAEVSCGITVRSSGTLVTVGSSDPKAELLDETQYRLGNGPCLHCLDSIQVVDVSDVRAEHRWPEYIQVASKMGLRCSLSMPLASPDGPLGAMNVYGFEEPALFADEGSRRQIELLAAQVAGALRIGLRLVKDAVLLDQMEQALQSRTVIDQAIGILVERVGCTPTAAFGLLRRLSQTSGRRLGVLAAELVVRASGESPPDAGKPFDR